MSSFFYSVKSAFIQQGLGELYMVAIIASGFFLLWMALSWWDSRSSYGKSRIM